MSYLKQKLSLPLVKYSALGIASCLWVFGLVDQFYESAAMMKYLLLSLLMAAVAFHLAAAALRRFGTKPGPPGFLSGRVVESEQERDMFVPLLAVPLAVQLIAAAEGVPKLNVTAELQGRRAGRLHRDDARSGCRSCIDSEHRTRDQLDKDWSSFPAGARTFCLVIDPGLRADLHRARDLPGDEARHRELQARAQPAARSPTRAHGGRP